MVDFIHYAFSRRLSLYNVIRAGGVEERKNGGGCHSWQGCAGRTQDTAGRHKEAARKNKRVEIRLKSNSIVVMISISYADKF